MLKPVKAHYSLGLQIAQAEEAKKKAAIDEDYEAAAMYKKKILKLKEDAITVEKLRTEFLNKKPTLRLSSLFELMNRIDPVFT